MIIKGWLVISLLVLSACNSLPFIQPAPRLITPIVESNGACTGSAITLSQAQLYSDQNNRWSLIAEATNMRVDDSEIVRICISMEDKDGNARTEEQYLGTTLLGYEKLPFRLLLKNAPEQNERVLVAAQPLLPTTENNGPATLTRGRRNFIYSISKAIDESKRKQYLPLQIAGSLGNSESQPLMNVRVIIGMYDVDGKLIGVANGLAVDIAPLAPVVNTKIVIEGEPAK